MKDYIIRGNITDIPVRFFAINSTNMVEEARKIHNTTPTASAALGRSLSAVSMMTMMLKNKQDKVSIQIKGNGPANSIVVMGDMQGHIKGDIYNPVINIPLKSNGKLDVSGAVGNGTLTVIKDIGLKRPYIGQIELVSGEIAEDLTYYFAISEQIPSVVSLGVLVDVDQSIMAAGGFIIQLLPDCPEEIISYIEKRISEIPSISNLIKKKLIPEEIMELFFRDFEINIIEKKNILYNCDCNKDRLEAILISLGKNEIKDMINSKQDIEVVCHFCGKKYIFEKKDLEILLKK